MLLFNDADRNRVFSRKNAIGIKTLEISQDVLVGDSVQLNVNPTERKLEIVPSKEDDNIRVLTKVIGVTKQCVSTIKVMACDDVILLNLVDGALFVDKPSDDEKMLIYNGINVDKLGKILPDDIQWVDVDRLLGVTQYFGKYASEHAMDYIHTVEVSVRKTGELSVKRVEEDDISLGGFEILDRKEQARQSRLAFIKAEKQSKAVDADDEYDDYDEDEEEEVYDEDEDLYI